jgi:hypothetical protein
MNKRVFFIMFLVASIYTTAFSQVSDEIKQELIKIYTSYAQSKKGSDRLQYIRNPQEYKSIFENRYGDRDVSFTPIKFGKANNILSGNSKNDAYTPNLDIYVLEEIVEGNQGGKTVEVIQYRYFVKTGNNYKMDWEATVCYNPITLSRFKVLEDGQIATFRCYANLSSNDYDGYFSIGIRDEATNYQFTAYIKKDSEDGLALMEYLEEGSARPVILEMKYVDTITRYGKKALITKFVNKGWVK